MASSRRSIKDLVRQETQKPSESDATTTDVETADSGTKTSSAKNSSTQNSGTKDPDSSSPDPEPSPQSTKTRSTTARRSASSSRSAVSTTPRRTTMTKADLEGLVKELKADLAMALESQQAVQEQLTNLQTQLEEKDQLITNLKEGIATQTAAQEKQHHELEDKLQGRLQNAEAAALKLSQTNTELAQELTTLKQENKNSKSTSQPLSRPLVPMAQPLVQKPASLALADSKRLMKPQIIHRPQHVNTQPGEPEDFAKSAWLL